MRTSQSHGRTETSGFLGAVRPTPVTHQPRYTQVSSHIRSRQEVSGIDVPV
jgi:hypothetical protein